METDLDQFLLDCTSSRVDSGNSLSNDQESQENNSSNRNSFSFGVNSSQGGNAGDSSGCASPVAEKFGSATGFEETSSVQENRSEPYIGSWVNSMIKARKFRNTRSRSKRRECPKRLIRKPSNN